MMKISIIITIYNTIMQINFLFQALQKVCRYPNSPSQARCYTTSIHQCTADLYSDYFSPRWEGVLVV